MKVLVSTALYVDIRRLSRITHLRFVSADVPVSENVRSFSSAIAHMGVME